MNIQTESFIKQDASWAEVGRAHPHGKILVTPSHGVEDRTVPSCSRFGSHGSGEQLVPDLNGIDLGLDGIERVVVTEVETVVRRKYPVRLAGSPAHRHLEAGNRATFQR